MVKWLKAPSFSFFRIFASSHLRIFSLCFSCLHGYFFHHKGLEVHFLRQFRRCHYGSTQPRCCVCHCSFLYMAGRPSPACNCSKACHLLYPGHCHWAILNFQGESTHLRFFVTSRLFKANFFSQLSAPSFRLRAPSVLHEETFTRRCLFIVWF